MNGQYNYPSFDGQVPSWSMQQQYYGNNAAQYEQQHLHHSQQVPVQVAQVPQHSAAAYPSSVDAQHYAYGYPSYAQSYAAPPPTQQQPHGFAMEQPSRSRFAFASTAPQAHQFTLPPPAYSYAAAYAGQEEQMRSQSHERAAGWGAGGNYGRQESAQRATLQDSYEPRAQGYELDDDKTVLYDLIPNTSSVPPPPPVELSAVPLADLAVEMVWEACRQGFLVARDNQIAAAHAASSQRRRSGRESFGTIGDGRLRSSSADGFSSDNSSVSSSSPGTPGVVSVQEEEARRQRLANLGLSDFMNFSTSRKSSIPTLSSSVFPVEPSVAFRQFVKQILSATLVTPEDLVLALYYVSQIAPTDIIPPTPAEGGQDAQTTSFKAAPFKIFLGSLMIANKSLQDNSYRNETFATVSGIPLKDVNALEIFVFSTLGYDVALREDKWVGWLNTIAFKVLAGVRGDIGDRFAIEEALGRLVYAARNNKHFVTAAPSTSSITPVAAPTVSTSTPVETLGDVDFDEAGPIRRRTPASRAGLCRATSDVNALLPPVSLSDMRSRSFGWEVTRSVC